RRSPMRTHRIYASWLPPNQRERAELLKMRRMQHLVIAWMAGLIPGGWLVALLAPDETVFVPFTLVWIALGLWFAERIGARRCPRCGDDFCEKRDFLLVWLIQPSLRELRTEPEKGGRISVIQAHERMLLKSSERPISDHLQRRENYSGQRQPGTG